MLIYKFYDYKMSCLTKKDVIVVRLDNHRFYILEEDINGKWYVIDELNITSINDMTGKPEELAIPFTNNLSDVLESLNNGNFFVL